MKTLLLTAASSNEKSLNNFIKFLKENFKNKPINILILGRSIEKKKVFTILKSPHVNKVAQEQFEKRKKIVRIFLISKKCKKTIIAIKKILNTIFHDIKFTIKYLTNNNCNKNNALNIFKSTDFKIYYPREGHLNKFSSPKKPVNDIGKVKFKTYLNIWSNYGDILLKNRRFE